MESRILKVRGRSAELVEVKGQKVEVEVEGWTLEVEGPGCWADGKWKSIGGGGKWDVGVSGLDPGVMSTWEVGGR